MTAQFFPIDRLRQFSADGQVYRSFNHLIAASMGQLLLVPIHLVAGRCDDVIDGCPVPWGEVHAVLEYPRGDERKDFSLSGDFFIPLARLASIGIDPDECETDHITPMINGEEKVLRLVHPCGVRYAVVMG